MHVALGFEPIPGEVAGQPPATTSPEPLINRDGSVVELGETALAGSFWYYRNVLRNSAQELDFATQDALIMDVANGLSVEERYGEAPQDMVMAEQVTRGRDARIQLAVSFTERVVNIVQWNCNRVGRRDASFQEEILQEGVLGLVESIVGFAKLPEEEQHAFWAYAQKTITNKVRGATRDELLGKSIRKADVETRDLGRYFSARRELTEQHGHTPSDAAIAEAMGVPFERAYTLRQWAERHSSIFDVEDEKEGALEHVEQRPPANLEAEILLERALEFFPPNQQTMMRMRFGIGDTPQLTTGEIARTLGMNETWVSTTYTKDRQTLSEIVSGLMTNSLDIEKLRIRSGLRGRNVVTMFHLLGIPLPKEARLPELREQAIQLLSSLVENDRARTIMRELYDLQGSNPSKTHKELGAELGISGAYVRAIEKKVLERFTIPAE